jgi:hypothetical protein
LPSIVCGEGSSVYGAVVFDREPRRFVEQVDATGETAVAVVDRDLNTGSGKTAEDEKRSQTRFHRRLGVRIGESERSPELVCATPPPKHLGTIDELVHAHAPGVKRRVQEHDVVDKGERAAGVRQAPDQTRRAHAFELDDVRVGNRDPADPQP